MAYIYRHIRLDKNEPFYIGIGSDEGTTEKNDYVRARASWCRNTVWERITQKTKYRVEIMLHDISWEEACEKEIFFIKLYGRKDLGNGSLCNLTDGGEGAYGYKRSKEMNENALWYKAIPIYQYDLEGNFIREWKSAQEASRSLKIDGTGITGVLRGEHSYSKGYMFRYKDGNLPINIESCRSSRYKPIYQFTKEGKFIKKWSSVEEAERILGKIGIYKVLIGKTKTSSGFRWSRNKTL